MKKFGKFIFGTLTAASVAAGAYYLYKTYIKKDSSDDFDDFEDDFEDFDTEEEEDNKNKDSREYVSIHIAPDEKEAVETANESDPQNDEEENDK